MFLKSLVLVWAAAAMSFAQPIVSNFRVDWISHSGARLKWNNSGTSTTCYWRSQLGQTPAFELPAQGTPGGAACQLNDGGITLSGLKPSTTYYISPQTSFDNLTWSAPCPGCLTTFTTLALPLIHPALPLITGLWDPVLPDTSGYNQGAAYTVGPGCVAPTIQDLATAAVETQPLNGTIIFIPPGVACPHFSFPQDTQVLAVPNDPVHVNTSTGVFTASNNIPGWTLTENQVVRLAAWSCLPDSKTHGNGNNSYNPSTEGCTTQGQLSFGTDYNMVNVNAAANTFQLATAPGGTPIIPGDVGGNYPACTSTCPMQVVQWPPMHSNWIIIRTSTPDSVFCPPGVRCPAAVWGAKMGGITTQTGAYFGNGPTTSVGNHHIAFVGIQGTYADNSAQALTTVDPTPSNEFFFDPTNFATSYIWWDRSDLSCAPFPNRCTDMFTDFGGSFKAITNSVLRNLNFWRPSVTPTTSLGTVPHGLTGSIAGQTLTFIPGATKLGPINNCANAAMVSVTVTGGSIAAAATGYAYVDSACHLTVAVPPGLTGTCLGTMNDKNAAAQGCAFLPVANPGWPRDPMGGINCLTLGTFNIAANGAISGYNDMAQYGQTSRITEGTQAIQIAGGPGPFSFNNNFVEGTGLTLHLNDGSIIDVQKISFRRNYFKWDQRHRMGSPTSDGYRHANRNGPECKHCRADLFDGNIIDGMWADVSPDGPAILWHTGANNGTTGTADNYTVEDIQMSNNTVKNSSTGFEFGSNGDSNVTPQPVAARIRLFNNIILTNGFKQVDDNASQANVGGTAGNCVEIDGAIEDLIVDHMTCVPMGTNPQLYHSQANFIEGGRFTANLWFFSGSYYGISAESPVVYPVPIWPGPPAIGGTGAALFNTQFVSGPGNPSGVMTGNVAVPYYTSFATNPPTGLVPASQICTNFGGVWNGTACVGGLLPNILTGATAAANLAAVGFTSALDAPALNLTLSPASLLHVANQPDVGVDMDALLTAQGAVGTPVVSLVTQTSATISLYVYDPTMVCPLDYALSPNDPESNTLGRLIPVVTGNVLTVNLKNLITKSGYAYRWLCPVYQPTGVFSTK